MTNPHVCSLYAVHTLCIRRYVHYCSKRSYACLGTIASQWQAWQAWQGMLEKNDLNPSLESWQDPREFSDDGSEDSGFEESVSATDHTKEQRLKNDKYDMALEVI